MMLPQKLGTVTLMRLTGSDGSTETYSAILDEPAGKQVVAHRLTGALASDPSRIPTVRARVQDLTAVRHPLLAPILDFTEVRKEYLAIEEHIDSVDLATVIATCRSDGRRLPPNLFLNLATQICNALEAMHGRPGKSSGSENVLHLALQPAAVRITPDGRLILGGYDLGVPPNASDERALARIGALAPEQTQSDPEVNPATDIFALGSLLFELLTLEPLFRAETGLQTLHAVRKAEVSAALQRVKKQMPGLDKVLYRALSLNPRHRYQRAFVLREDIRGLMAGYSFTRITEDLVEFLKPVFDARAIVGDSTLLPEDAQDTTAALLRNAAIGGAAADAAVGLFGRDDDTSSPVPVADIDGIEMWSEVPTSVDPTQPEISPTPSPPPTKGRQQRPSDETNWFRRNLDAPPSDAFDNDEHTDVTDSSGERPTHRGRAPATFPNFSDFVAEEKRQLSSEEAAELGLKRRPLPPPKSDPTATGVPTSRRSQSYPGPRKEVIQADSQRTAREQQAKAERARAADEASRKAAEDAERAEKAKLAAELAKKAAAQHARAEQAKAAPPKPAPEPKPAPQPEADDLSDTIDQTLDEDLDWRPRRRGRGVLYAVVGLAVFLLIILCGGGGIYGVYLVGQQVQLAATSSYDDAASTVADALKEPDQATDPAPTEAADGAADAVDSPPGEPAETAAPPEIAPSETAPSETARSEPTTRPEPSRSEPTTRPEPSRSEPVASRAEPSRVRSSSPPRSTESYAASAASLAPPPITEPEPESYVARDPDPDPISADLADEDLDALSQRAHSGSLSSGEQLKLKMVETTEDGYSRAQALLYYNARASGDKAAQRTHIESLLARPENRYNPIYLVEGARLDVNDKRYDRALQRADTAERHWARIPSELIYSRKAMIYELQAVSWQGLFNTSGGEDLNALQRAISGWEKYQRHVNTKNDTRLARRADEQLRKLYDAKRRLE